MELAELEMRWLCGSCRRWEWDTMDENGDK